MKSEKWKVLLYKQDKWLAYNQTVKNYDTKNIKFSEKKNAKSIDSTIQILLFKY